MCYKTKNLYRIHNPLTMKNYSSTKKLSCWIVILQSLIMSRTWESSHQFKERNCLHLHQCIFCYITSNWTPNLGKTKLCKSNYIVHTLPKHCFITWLGTTNRLAIREKLVKWMPLLLFVYYVLIQIISSLNALCCWGLEIATWLCMIIGLLKIGVSTYLRNSAL